MKPAVADETLLMTVEGAWAAYDLAERELWETYAASPSFLAGREYIAGEHFARRRCDRAVERIRYQRVQ